MSSAMEMPRRAVLVTVMAVGVVLVIAFSRLVSGSNLSGAHTFVAASVVFASFTTGILAIFRYYLRRDSIFFFIGLAFLSASVMDGYHLLAEGAHVHGDVSLLWSPDASRLYLAIALAVSVGALELLRVFEVEEGKWENDLTILLAFVACGALAFWYFSLVRVGQPIVFSSPLNHPVAFAALFAFVIVAIGFFRRWRRGNNDIEPWIVFAAIFAALAEAVTILFSKGPVGEGFGVAHIINDVSYGIVLFGVLASLNTIYREEKEGRQHYAAIVNTTEEAILTIDAKGMIITVNPAAEWMFGYRVEDLIGKNVKVLMPERFRAEHDNHVAGYRPTTPSKVIGVDRQLEGRRLDGSIFPLELQITTALVKDERVFIGLMHDITKRMSAQKQIEQQVKDLEEFNYVVSHDLQEPLRTLTNYCKLLIDDMGGRIPDEAREDIRYITEAAARMRCLVNDLLQLSRATNQELTRAPVNIGDCVETVKRDLHSAIAESDATIKCAHHLPTVLGDQTLLTSVFQNLISNGIKFRNDQPPRIEVGAQRVNGSWEISVTDNGIGIEDGYRDQIFGAFKRLHGRKAYDGTGIGLAVVKKIIERHGGNIRVDSAPDKGSKFIFTLPHHSDEAVFPDGDSLADVWRA